MIEMSYYTDLFFLQTFSQLTIAFFIGFLVRKAFLSLGIFLFYFLILEPVFVNIARFKFDDIGRFLPLAISNRMLPVPAFMGKLSPEGYQKALDAIPLHIILTLIFTSLIWFFCFKINSKRDL